MSALRQDILASIVVFLVALPLCLGIALASGAPLFSGVLAGIVGGIVVGSLSGSHTSVSGPAAGLTAVVAAQIANLGTFEAFLLAVVFSVRVAGNIIGTKSLGSIEYGVAVAGVKLVLVLGHTRCGAVTSSVELLGDHRAVKQPSGCSQLSAIVDEIHKAVDSEQVRHLDQMTPEEKEACIDRVARNNVKRTVREIVARNDAIRASVNAGKVAVAGAMYDVKSGVIEFFSE